MTDPQLECHRTVFVALVIGMCAVLLTAVLLM
jgi:hypothetical protein